MKRRMLVVELALLPLLAACGAAAATKAQPGSSAPSSPANSGNVDLVGLRLFPSTYAGSYDDGTNTVLLFTADPAASAKTVAGRVHPSAYRAASAQYSLAQLQAAAQTLESPSSGRAGVSAVSIDERANRVDLTAASDAEASRLLSTVDRRVITVSIGIAKPAGATAVAPSSS